MAEASVVLVGSVALAEVDELLSDELLDELLVGSVELWLVFVGFVLEVLVLLLVLLSVSEDDGSSSSVMSTVGVSELEGSSDSLLSGELVSVWVRVTVGCSLGWLVGEVRLS
ncbi:MAG: hypothetical protein U1U88_001393 [Lawsonella clevelandensis]